MQCGALLQSAGQTAGQRHFESVKNPSDAEGGDHQSVKSSPGQAVKPRWNVRFEDRLSLDHKRDIKRFLRRG